MSALTVNRVGHHDVQSPGGELGLYVHFPWCSRKCPYCDFLSIASERGEIPEERYTAQVCREVARRSEMLSSRRVTSIFFGGGTPSLWGDRGIGAVIETARQHFDCRGAEISVECNPSSFDAGLAQRLLAVGVNRVSIGVQSLDQERLRFLGRLHDPAGGLRAVEQALRAQVPAVSADLIFGVVGQRPRDAADEVATLADLGPSHLSAYALTIEPGTQFGALHRRGQLPLLPDDSVAECFLAVEEALLARGFGHYEISNYAHPGHEARHNLGYWLGKDYVAVGLGAWGTVTLGEQVVRYRNTVSVERYLAQPDFPVPSERNAGPGMPHAAFETLSVETRLLERLMLGLRLARGVDVPAVLAELGLDDLGDRRMQRIHQLAARQQVSWDGTTLRIPPSQWLLADGIIAQLA